MADLKVNPTPVGQTAQLVVDMQNAFCHAQGSVARLGMETGLMTAVIPAVVRAREWARQRGIPVIYTRNWFNEDFSNSGKLFKDNPRVKELGHCVKDTWDAAIVDELTPAAGELVINKTRTTAFYQTGFKEELEKRNIETLLVTGVATNVCVESTVRDATTRDFLCTVVRDATATLDDAMHQASLTSMEIFTSTATLKEVQDKHS